MSSSPGKPTFHNQPFQGLAKNTGNRRPAAPATLPNPVVEASPSPQTDAELFTAEMADVAPLSDDQRRQFVPLLPSTITRAIVAPDADVLDELCQLVEGRGTFDITDTVECIEGVADGVDRRLIRRLRNGEFAYQSHLDLHGLTAIEARDAVGRFLAAAHRRGQRCVLIIHGRGRNSKDHVPVLKHRLAGWLSRTSWARLVLAFTTARPCDGGVGALYVLLRRERSARRPISVTLGAKW